MDLDTLQCQCRKVFSVGLSLSLSGEAIPAALILGIEIGTELGLAQTGFHIIPLSAFLFISILAVLCPHDWRSPLRPLERKPLASSHCAGGLAWLC